MTGEEKLVFAIGKEPDGAPVIILGFSEAAWNFMRTGMTHTLDLSKLGHNLKIVAFGGKDRKEVLSQIPMDENTLDVRGLDFGFGGGE